MHFIFFICVLCDITDGFVARENNKMSKFGAKFDIVADIVSHSSLFIILLKNKKYKRNIVIALILLSIYGGICEGKFLNVKSKLIYKSNIISISEISDYILTPLFVLLGDKI